MSKGRLFDALSWMAIACGTASARHFVSDCHASTKGSAGNTCALAMLPTVKSGLASLVARDVM